MTYPTITNLPAAPSRQDPANFADEADAFLGALPTFQSEVNTAGSYIETKAGEALTSATNAATSASNAADSATEAAASATAAALEAAEWSSGASYTEGDVVWSGVDYGTYRAKTTHSGETTDPSSDTTNWALVAVNDLAALGVTASASELNILDGVTATGAELNYLDITTLGTSEASKAVTSDSNGVMTFSDGVNEGYTAVTSTSNATTIDCRDGNVFAHTMTENTTFTFSNPPSSGTAYGFTLKLVQDATARTVTWPASVDWVGAVAPTISTDSGEVDILVFFTHDGGTTWYGFTAGQDLS